MKKWSLFALSLLAGLSAYRPARAMDCPQDDQYVYCTITYYDMGDDRKKEALDDFKAMISAKVQQLKIPAAMDEATSKLLVQDDAQFQEIIDETQKRIDEYTQDGKAAPNGRVAGYFFTIGMNYSMAVPTGVLGPVGPGYSINALLTFAYIPRITLQLDKRTGIWTEHKQPDMDMGGMLEVGAGVGAAGGFAGRYGFGLIYGDTPHASDIIGAGVALGVTADASIPILGTKLLGLQSASKFLSVFNYIPNGLTLFTVKNKETKERNWLFYLTRDIIGPDAGFEVHGTMFVLMNAEELGRFTVFSKYLTNGVNVPVGPTPIPSHSPIPNPSGTRSPKCDPKSDGCDDDGNPLPGQNPPPVQGGPVIDFPHPVVPLVRQQQPQNQQPQPAPNQNSDSQQQQPVLKFIAD